MIVIQSIEQSIKKGLYMKITCALLLLTLFVTGCATDVERLDPTEITDLTGKWNDTDSREVSEEMIQDISTQSFMGIYAAKFGHKPTVIVGNIRNLSSEHIQTGTFIKDLERELTNSGRVIFVANPYERGQLRTERKEQQEWARPETRKQMHAETGADFMLIGSIKTIFETENRTTVKFYQVDLELIELQTNEKHWIGSKKIKKQVKKPFFRW